MRKKILFILLLLAVSAVFTVAALAFDNVVIHPKLTIAALDLYSSETKGQLTQEQTEWIRQGSIDEDADPRYTNHYYNPENNTGLTDLSETPFLFKSWLTFNSARDWLWRQDSNSGDYSIPAILDNYRRGNTRIAYLGVGHILHLFQDMAVPAHTRNDSHADGDPLEKWARSLGTINLTKVNFQKIADLNNSFDELALFSHENFFSRDSVDINQLSKMRVVEDSYQGVVKKYYVNKIDGRDVKICQVDEGSTVPSCFITYDDFRLQLDYWNALYPKAVGYSAGVINYFINEFEKIDKEKREVTNQQIKTSSTIESLATSTDQYNLGAIWSNFTYNYWQTRASYEELKQTISTQLGYFTEANKELAINMLSQATILGVEVVSSIKDPISASSLFKLQPVGAETIITYNPISSSSNGETGQVTFVMPGETDKSDQIWIFTVGTTTTGATGTMPDAIAPKITITSAPPQYTSATSALFEFSADEFPVIIFCRADGADLPAGEAGWQPCQGSSTLENLTEGYHNFEVKAFDAYHNESAIASSSWLIDLTAPISAINPLAAEYAKTGFEVSWQGSDIASGIASFDLEYRIAASSSPVDGAWQPWLTATSATSSIFNQTATSGDAVYFRVRATDRAGNSGAWSGAETKITIPPPPAPVCSLPGPAFTGIYSTRTAVANKNTAPTSTPDEPVFIIDIAGEDQGFMMQTHNPACGLQLVAHWGDSRPGSRLIIEIGYDPATNLFNGRYRFCTNGGNVNKISGDRCLDGPWWSGTRWFGHGYLSGSREVLINNSSAYLPWLGVE